MKAAWLALALFGCGGKVAAEPVAGDATSSSAEAAADTTTVDVASEDEAAAPPFACTWEHAFEGVSLYSLALDTNDDAVVSGTAYRPTGETTLDYDAFVARLDPAGKLLWQHQWGDVAEQVASRVAVGAAHEVVIALTAAGDLDLGGGPVGGKDRAASVVTLDAAGRHLWTRPFRAGYATSQALAVAPSGNVVVCGTAAGPIDFGGAVLGTAALGSTFLAALSPKGEHLWSKDLGGVSCRQLAVDSQGRVALVGTISGSVDLGGGPLRTVGDWDALVAVFDRDGRHVWSRSYGAARSDEANGVYFDLNDDVFVTGTFSLAVDFGGGLREGPYSGGVFALKLDRDGRHVFSHSLGSGAGDRAFSFGYAIAARDGAVFLTGSFHDRLALGGSSLVARDDPFGNRGSDAFMLSIDEAGAPRWARRFGGDSIDLGLGAALDRKGDVVFAGWYSGPNVVDGAVRTGGGFVTKCPR